MNKLIGVGINSLLIIFGTMFGILLKRYKILEKIGNRVFEAFAFVVIVMGIQGINLDNPILYLLFLMIGIAIGEIIDIDKQFNRFGNYIQKKLTKNSSNNNFAQGFIESSLLFCIGSMTFLGAIQSGIQKQHSIYITKGMIDGIASISMSMGYGISVILSSIAVFIYQGSLTLLASMLETVLTPETINMCVSIGSLFLIPIGTNMLKITKIKVANLLPAMFIPMLYQLITILF